MTRKAKDGAPEGYKKLPKFDGGDENDVEGHKHLPKDGAPEGYKKMPKFDGGDENDDSVEGHRK